MKRLILILAIALFITPLFSQEEEPVDTTWKFGGIGTFTMSQVALYQWAAGGEPSLSAAAMLNIFLNYNKDNVSWENNLDLGYGLIKQGKGDDALTKKSNDRIEFSSQYGLKASGRWYYSALVNFRTQFAEGYDYPNDSVMISDFFAPAYLTASIGMEYKPLNNLQFYISPLAGKFTFVMNDSLSNIGKFGVDPGNKFRAELGGFLKVAYSLNIMENVDLSSNVTFFSNYLENPEDIDVNAEFLLSMTINEFLSANINTMLIWDKDVVVQQDNGDQGSLQLKEVFGLGLSYKF
ncbi:MAG: DUF3078 domain-containing protein [Bacteroidota bacterium]